MNNSSLENKVNELQIKQKRRSSSKLKSIFSSKQNSNVVKQNSHKDSGGIEFENVLIQQSDNSFKSDSINEQSLISITKQNDETNFDSHKSQTSSIINPYNNAKQFTSRKSSIFQKLNSPLNKIQIILTQDDDVDQHQNSGNAQEQVFKRNSKELSILSTPTNAQNNNQLTQTLLQKRTSILKKNNSSLSTLTLNIKMKSEQNEQSMHSLSPSKYTKTEQSPTSENRKSVLFKLGQMINEDKVFFDPKSPDSEIQNKRGSNLMISQNGLVQAKRASIVRQNTMLQRRATLIEQIKEKEGSKTKIDSPKSTINNLDENKSFIFPNRASIIEVTTPSNLKQNTLNVPQFPLLPKRQSNLSVNTPKSDTSSRQSYFFNSVYPNNSNQVQNDRKQSASDEDLVRLYHSFTSKIKRRKMSNFEKVKMKRRQYENKIYNEFEPRLKTFAKFGFKMMEKEENEYLRPFMKECQTNEPKGTMFVNDLWSDQNIQKFLGNCKMIRDKLTLIKLAQKQQSRESVLKKINSSNQLYFSNGRISQANMSDITTIMKNVYSQERSVNVSQMITPRESVLSSLKKPDILNRKQEIDMLNSIHRDEMRKSFQKKNEQELLQIFQAGSNNKRSSIVVVQQENTSNRLSKPKSEVSFPYSFEQLQTQQQKLNQNNKQKEKHQYNKSSGYLFQQPSSSVLQQSTPSQNLNLNHKFKPIQMLKQKTNEIENSNVLDLSYRQSSKAEDFQISNKHQSKVMTWIGQIDQVIKDNDKMYEQLNKHIDKLQDVIIKRNDQNQINV